MLRRFLETDFRLFVLPCQSNCEIWRHLLAGGYSHPLESLLDIFRIGCPKGRNRAHRSHIVYTHSRRTSFVVVQTNADRSLRLDRYSSQTRLSRLGLRCFRVGSSEYFFPNDALVSWACTR